MKFIKKIPKLLRFIILLALLLIALFLIFLKIIGFALEPTPNMISKIESTGRDATCADLIGKWSILGSPKTWEFGEIEVRTVEIYGVSKLIRDGKFVELIVLWNDYRIEHPYTCDDYTRTAKIPMWDTAAPDYTAMCCLTTRLGAISEDRMVIYMGYGDNWDSDASSVFVIKRK